MHAAVLDWVRTWGADATSVLEIGSKNINGSVRTLFTGVARYVGVDPAVGPDVDIVADGATVTVDGPFDLVVCCEVLEHVDDATAVGIIANAYAHLPAGGRFVATMAGPGRSPHSAIDEQPIRPWEFYRNVDPATLEGWLADAGYIRWSVDQHGSDVRCVAWR